MDYVKNKSQIMYEILPHKKFNFCQSNHKQEGAVAIRILIVVKTTNPYCDSPFLLSVFQYDCNILLPHLNQKHKILPLIL